MSIFDRHTLSHEYHFSILCANYIGSIFLWQNMAFYIKVCNPTYFDIKVHTLWRFLYLVGQLENREKPIDNISRYCYIISREKPIDNISRYRG